MNPEQTRSELETILNQPEYQVYYEDNRSILQIWWDKAWEWINDRFGQLFINIGSPDGAGDGVLILVICLAVLLLAAAVVRLARAKEQKRRFQGKKPFQAASEKDWSYIDHLNEAKRQEDSGAHHPAVRHLFLALLLYFDEKEWLQARTWKTNGEYYEELRSINPETAEQFYRLAVLFDEVTYGDREISRQEYEEYRKDTMQWISLEKRNDAAGRKEGSTRV